MSHQFITEAGYFNDLDDLNEYFIGRVYINSTTVTPGPPPLGPPAFSGLQQFITEAGYFMASEDFYEYFIGRVYINNIQFFPAAPQEYLVAGMGMLNETGIREALYGLTFVLERAEPGVIEIPPVAVAETYPSALLIPGF